MSDEAIVGGGENDSVNAETPRWPIASNSQRCSSFTEAHPSLGAYSDLMRRESDKTQSAIATAQMTLTLLGQGDMTDNYATVALRQSLADLTGVATDLDQVHAPTASARTTQNALHHLVKRQAQLLGQTLPRLGDPGTVRQSAQRLSAASNQEQQLSNRLP